MKNFIKYFLVLACLFAITISTVNAAKTDKTEKTTSTETKKEETKTEETKEPTKKQKVTLYLFRRTGCGHCAAEMTFLDTIVPEYKNKLNIVVYDVTQGNNSTLLGDVADKLGVGVSGVPFNVIGTKTQEGYGESISEEFLNMIDEAYELQEKDIVKELLEKNDYKDLKSTTLYEAMDEEELEYTSAPGSKTKKDGLVLAIIVGAVVVAIGTLVYYSRKN